MAQLFSLGHTTPHKNMDTDILDIFTFFIGLVVWILIFGLVGALIGKRRGRIGSGVFWGVLFGPLGWLITALLTDLRPKCSLCGAAVNRGATRCCHCGGEISSGTLQEYERWKKSKEPTEPIP